MAVDDSSVTSDPPSTSRNRLSLILQLASTTATKKIKKRSAGCRGYNSTVSSLASPFDRYNFASATTSTTSIADTLLSTPHEALLPSQEIRSGLPSPTVDPIPPTTNDLSAEEKMQLLKKVRKLSRVLGEYPVPTSLDDDLNRKPTMASTTEQSSPPPLSPTSPTSSGKSGKPKRRDLKRSITVGYHAGGPHNHKQTLPRSRSFAALHPSLNHPDIDLPRPSSPITFAKSGDSDASSVKIPSLVQSPSELAADDSIPSRRSSVSSLSSDPQCTSQRMQRTRAAKLTHQLGDSVPPDVLLRATSPPPQLPPSPAAADSSTSPDQQAVALSRESTSLRRSPRDAKRRLSLDLHSLTGMISAPSTPSVTANDKLSPDSIRRTRSMLTRSPRKGATEDGRKEIDDISRHASFEAGPISEKQRVLNVKRARKMTQLFGDIPPTALFQITNVNQDGSTMESSEDNDLRFRRASLATILSISAASTLSFSSNLSHQVYSGSSEAVAVVTTAAVPPVEAMDTPAASDVQEEKQGSSSEVVEKEVSNSTPNVLDDSTSSSQTATPVLSEPFSIQNTEEPMAKPKPKPSLRSLRPSTAPPSSSSIRDLSVPSTPPPFASAIASRTNLLESQDVIRVHNSSKTDISTSSSSQQMKGSTPEFHVRQRRAAKLSKFFGVGMNDLANLLPPLDLPGPSFTDAATATTSTSPIEPSNNGGISIKGSGGHRRAPSTSIVQSNGTTTVEVSAVVPKGPLRFLGGAKEFDMDDAIEQLRKMKST
ncbi:hypothetical protein ABKN59_001132 [Abortiporus biennis]